MSEIKKIHIFFIFISVLYLINSLFINYGPWDEYHLLYFFKNKILFPLYDNNFIYYNPYLLGRFSPVTSQEFNILILLGFSIDSSFFFVSLIIILTSYLYFYLLNKNFKFFNFKIFFFFILIIISSPGFYLLSTRLLYAEDTLTLLIIIFLIFFLKSVNSINQRDKIFNYLFLILITAFTLLYKENSFVVILSFIFSFYYFNYKDKKKYNVIIFCITFLSLIYLFILGYINLIYKDQNLSYLSNENSNFIIESLFTFIRYAFFNDPIIFFFFIPFGIYGIFSSKNIFYKSIFISGFCNIFFYISLGLYGPYYTYPCYFLMFPLFVETFLFFTSKIKIRFILINFIFILFLFFSFFNAIFYYFESKNLSLTFNNAVNFMSNEIKKNKSDKKTKIFICNKLDSGNLAKIYIFGEYLKFNNIESERFEFFSLNFYENNFFYSHKSPFDKHNQENYDYSIFKNKNKFSTPTKGDFILKMSSYSNNNQNNCSILDTGQYSEKIFYTSSFYNTLITNFIKVIFYKKKFNKNNFLRTFEYKIFRL